MQRSSVAAKIADQLDRERQRARVLRLINRRPKSGFTCDEVEQRLDMLHQTASARMAELSRDGLIYESGRVKPTRTGCRARVMLPAYQCGVGRPAKS